MRPHVPEGRRYARPEWEPYCEGYYQALVMSLRVMRLAFDRWKEHPMPERTNGTPATVHLLPTPAPVAPAPRDAWKTPILVALATCAAIFVCEVLVLMGALIYRAVW